jgi:hypothetical protein
MACFNVWCMNGAKTESVARAMRTLSMSPGRLRMFLLRVAGMSHAEAINRHKMTTLTPALHCNDYSPDDNRFDLRPFLYPPFWQSWGFKKIDRELEKMEKARAEKHVG